MAINNFNAKNGLSVGSNPINVVDNTANATFATAMTTGSMGVGTPVVATARLFVSGTSTSSDATLAIRAGVPTPSGRLLDIRNNSGTSVASVDYLGNIFGVSGSFSGDVSITGNLTVAGTQTIINSDIVNVKDNIVLLNAGPSPASTGGIYVADTVANTTGSLVWDSVTDQWKAGRPGTETTLVSGSGTNNYVTKWVGSNAVGAGVIFDDGTNVGIGTTLMDSKFVVAGNVVVSGSINPSADNNANYFLGTASKRWANVVATSFSGSLTKLSDGTTSYLQAGSNIAITTGSNGSVTIATTGLASTTAQYLTLTADASLSSERVFTPSTGLKFTDGGAGGNYTLSINDSVVATVSGTTFTGVTNHNAGLSGSLTRLTDGTSYLIAGTGITIATGSNGSVTITGNVGDITSVSAGNGLLGGGTSGDVSLSINNSVVATISGSTFTGAVKFNSGLSGSLTQLVDGTSYLIAGSNIQISTGSNGSVNISSPNAATNSSAYITVGNDSTLTNERALTAGTGLKSVDGGANGAFTLSINDSVVATISGTTFTGATRHNAGLSGSLTKLTDGTSYLVAGSNVQIVTGTNGSVTITSTASGASYVAGSTTQVQFNDGGTFGADADFTFDKNNNLLKVTNISGSLTGSNVLAGQVVIAGAGGVLSGTNEFVWDNALSRVGVGTSAPANKFHILGSSNDTVNRANSNLTVEGGGGNGLVIGTYSSAAFPTYVQSGYVSNFVTATYALSLNPLGGNVGIGITNPSQLLHVAGDVNVSSGQGFRINNTATSGQYLRGDGTRFVSSAIQAADVPTLNQSTTGNAATATALQNARTLWGQSFDGTANVTGNLTSVGNITGTAGVNLTATSATLALTATGANAITATTNGSERLRVDAAGNVGIGTADANGNRLAISGGNLSVTGSVLPGVTTAYDIGSTTYRWRDLYARTGSFSGDVTITGDLTVNGTQFIVNTQVVEIEDNAILLNAGPSPASTGGIYVADTTTGVTGSLLWDSVTDRWKAGKLGSEVSLVSGSGTNNYVTKWSGANAVGSSIIYDDGTNVGVGTGTPANKFHIFGSSNDTVNRANANLTVEGGGGNGFVFGTYSTSRFASYIQSGFVSNFGTATYVLSLNPLGGNVGIGTSTTTDSLAVNGSMSVTGSVLPGTDVTYTLGNTTKRWSNVVSNALTGSLTKLSDGTTDYLQAGTNIAIVTGSNGSVTISTTGLASTTAQYLTLAADASLTSERIFTPSTGLKASDGGAGGNYTLTINDSIVATVSGTTFTGVTKHNAGLSGSLTKLTDGTSYIVAGQNVQVTTGSNGSITITSVASGATYVAGSNSQVQFNDGGTFGADADFTFDKNSNLLKVTNISGSLTGSNVLAGHVIVAGTGGVLSGTNNLFWNNTNSYLGIGTSNPGYKLTIIGTGGVIATDNNASFVAKNTSGTYESWVYPRQSDGLMYIDYAASGLRIRNSTGAVTTLAADNSGNVGLGTATPSQKLHVYNGYAYFENGYGIKSGGEILLEGNGTNTNIKITTLSAAGSYPNAKVLYVTNPSSELLTVLNSGNVGIGSASPGDKLSVNGTVSVTGSLQPGTSNTYALGSTSKLWSTVHATNLSGSLTKLSDGTSYIVAGSNVTVTTGSSGAVTISTTGLAPLASAYLTVGNDATLTNERSLSAGTGLLAVDGGANSAYTLSINNSIVATVSGTTFTGVTNHNAGLSGSLTKLTDGTSYLIAGSSIQIATGSTGAVTITSTATGATYVAGSNTQVQFNDGGTFGADGDFTFDKNSNLLRVTNISGSLTGSNVLAGQVVVAGTGGLVSGSNNFWWDDANSRVGIGTSSFSARLHVSGSSTSANSALVLRAGVPLPTAGILDVQGHTGSTIFEILETAVETTIPFRGPNGTATAPTFSFTGGQTTGMYRRTSGQLLSFTVSGVQSFGIDTNGNAAIGVSATSQSSGRLHVQGGSGAGDATTTTLLVRHGVANGANLPVLDVQNSASTSLLFVSGSGNVGIGTTVTTDRLAVNGSMSVTGSVLPGVDNTYDLGSSTKRWANVYANNVVSSGSLGPAYTSPSSTSGTTALFDTVSVSTDAAVYELMIIGNPNSSASAAYRDVIYGKVIIGTGNNGATVRNYIQFISESPAPRSLYGAAGNGPLVADVVYLQAGNEFTDIAQGGTATLRVKITGYAAGFVGNNTTVRLKQLA